RVSMVVARTTVVTVLLPAKAGTEAAVGVAAALADEQSLQQVTRPTEVLAPAFLVLGLALGHQGEQLRTDECRHRNHFLLLRRGALHGGGQAGLGVAARWSQPGSALPTRRWAGRARTGRALVAAGVGSWESRSPRSAAFLQDCPWSRCSMELMGWRDHQSSLRHGAWGL